MCADVAADVAKWRTTLVTLRRQLTYPPAQGTEMHNDNNCKGLLYQKQGKLDEAKAIYTQTLQG